MYTNHTVRPICPYCGSEERDAWELNLSDGETTIISCGRCDEDYEIECHVDVSYSTKQVIIGRE